MSCYVIRCKPYAVSIDNKQSISNWMTKYMTPEWVAHQVFMEAGDGDTVLLRVRGGGWRGKGAGAMGGGCLEGGGERCLGREVKGV